MLKSSVQNRILTSLPDDRPITAIQIIESIDKCPVGFYPVCKTYDQDSDADLRENSIFKSSGARYLCLSKTEGLPNFVVQEILVLTDKANPPNGFSLLHRTADTEQKPWRKKQFCYRLVNRKDIRIAVTDIILCSRLKKAPFGFSFAGELNGVTICYKMGNVQDSEASPDANGRDGNPLPSPPARPPKPSASPMSPNSPMYPSLGESDHDYEILRPGYPPSGPARPAPRPPVPLLPHQHSTHTLGIPHALDGVPFIVNPKFLTSTSADKIQFPRIKAKTMQQILRDYDYPFTVERQT